MTPSELSYREIPLSRGKVALVDIVDFEWLSQWKWNAHKDHGRETFYATRGLTSGKTISMHREILALEPGDRRVADHINHDTLDNRRSNLRIATLAESTRNRRRWANTASGYKGVGKYGDRWLARIKINGKLICVGRFSTPEEAHHAYCEASKQYHGDFGCAQ